MGMSWGRVLAMAATRAALDRAYDRYPVYGCDGPRWWATVRRRRPGKRKAWQQGTGKAGGGRRG